MTSARASAAFQGSTFARSAQFYRAFGIRGHLTGDTARAGNPAAVAFCSGSEDTSLLSSVARELAFPMTAFLSRTGKPGTYGIRYFSGSGAEFQLCGHATFAAARHVADVTGRRDVSFLLARPLANFHEVTAQVSDDKSSVQVTLPRARLTDHTFRDGGKRLSAIAGLDRRAIAHTAVSDLGDLLVVLWSPLDLRSIELDMEAAATLTERGGFRGILATSWSRSADHDVENRAFFPASGIDEDIACGSANCTILPYWHAHLGAPRCALRIGYPGGSMDHRLPMRGTMVGSMTDRSATVSLAGAVELDGHSGAPLSTAGPDATA